MTKKELIFHAGAKLFAERSYDIVGIRDIANEAGVNSAMISYYYGGKSGLLRDIFIRFSSLVMGSIEPVLEKTTDINQMGKYTAESLLKSARTNRDIYLVGLKELNREREELIDLREELQERGWANFSRTLDRLGLTKKDDDDYADMTFTVVIGMVFSDYLLGGGTYIDDDTKIEKYTNIVTTILRHGSAQLWK
ncbi:TetR family transcriptional regulator [uncultured Pseudodesulfovibrio sp.]|uniref:TetR/AcrR family transcriptional regulator n=1 Tax=uncultured Pseudodesulfovibrio sp. TaxID=2035858 RepID=UPI0029C8A935|nr:TetR family transcriptional regulator [uncultured Pseudodesulfovibrio sp.]